MLLRLSLFLEGWSVYVLCCVSLFTSGDASIPANRWFWRPSWKKAALTEPQGGLQIICSSKNTQKQTCSSRRFWARCAGYCTHVPVIATVGVRELWENGCSSSKLGFLVCGEYWVPTVQLFSQESLTPTVAKEFQIGLNDAAEADLKISSLAIRTGCSQSVVMHTYT